MLFFILRQKGGYMKYNKHFAVSVLLALFMFLSQSKADASQLRLGSTGQEVTYVQSILNKLGYFHVDPTGYYGYITKEAVEDFQQDFGIMVVGEVGPITSRTLNDVVNMAHVVYGESRGESYEGQVAVAAVILNRVHSIDFPDTIQEVIFQRNAFTAIRDGQFYLPANKTAYKAVKDAYLGWDPSFGAVYYFNPKLATDEWIFTRTVNTKIDNHLFAY
jgi:N-acetylmuramoyl-L-alanine amidase